MWIHIKAKERTAKNTCLKKMEVTPLAPGIKESVDKCTKKNRIQSQKWQYEIAHMYNYVRKNSSHHPKKWIIRFHSNGIVNPSWRDELWFVGVLIVTRCDLLGPMVIFYLNNILRTYKYELSVTIRHFSVPNYPRVYTLFCSFCIRHLPQIIFLCTILCA